MNSDHDNGPESTTGAVASAKFTCPGCGALLYSQRSKLCDRCGTHLPSESILTDEQVAARKQERKWARNLADAFDTTDRVNQFSSELARTPGSPENAQDILALADTMKRLSWAAEFKHRNRPTWLYVAGWLITLPTLVLCIWFMVSARSLTGGTIVATILLTGFHAFCWFEMWLRAAPVCPNCKQDIRICSMKHCHRCGKPMAHHRCEDCGVDNTWIGVLKPFNDGMNRHIVFCPGCGVELDTYVRRLRAGK